MRKLLFASAILAFPFFASADTTAFTAPGTYTYHVPAGVAITVTVDGAGQGGTGGTGSTYLYGTCTPSYGSSGEYGSDSSFNGTLIGRGGAAHGYGMVAGGGGGAIGGDTNTPYGGASGGAGGSGASAPECGGGASPGAVGESGGRAVKTYQAGTLPSTVTVVVGRGGAGGQGGDASSCYFWEGGGYQCAPYVYTGWGGAGGNGSVVITTGDDAALPVASSSSASCSISFDQNPLAPGDGTYIRWSSAGASWMYIAGVGYVRPNESGAAWVQPSQTTDYNGTVGGASGNRPCSGTQRLVVSSGADEETECTARYSCSGDEIIYIGADCSISPVRSCPAPLFCSSGSSVCLDSSSAPIAFVPFDSSDSIHLSGHLTALPTLVFRGDTSRLFWNVTNASSCSVKSSNGSSWEGLFSGIDGKPTLPITEQTTITLTCEALPGISPATYSETEYINVLPIFREI